MTSTAPSIAAVQQRFDDLYHILTSPKFLDPSDSSPDTPLYLQTYDIRRQSTVNRALAALTTRLQTSGISVLSIDLLSLVRELLQHRSRLDDLLQMEPEMPRRKVIDVMARNASVSDNVIPALQEKLQSASWQIVFLSGSGSVYPFLRIHTLLEVLPSIMDRRPVIVFYPGEYTYRPTGGSELRLFGTMETSGHYRAFNLDQIRIPS